MDEHEYPRYNTALLAWIGFIVFPILLGVIWLFVVFNVKYRTCVPLENGLNLGYAAVFDLSNPYLKPIAVPKFEDGTPLIYDKTWEIYVTDKAIYGLALGETVNDDYIFAWRSDTGLILKDQAPEIYDQIISNSGPANWDIDVNSIGTGALLNILLNRQEFENQTCRTRLLTW